MVQIWIDILTYLEPAACGVVLIFLLRSGSVRKYLFLTLFLAVRLCSTLFCLSIVRLSSEGIEKHLAYRILFYTYWTSYALEGILSLLIIYGLYRLAMRPLEGLQRLGTLVFRWAAAISGALAFGFACNSHSPGAGFIQIVTQLQQTSSILTLCLMLFVCFAVRPIGLSYRDRIFGVSFGLGVMASASLIESAWIAHNSSVQSYVSLANGVATCSAFMVWAAYFAFPERKRGILAIPTTSPYLHWNQISEALGADPGVVAIGGLPPDVFAPVELEMMFRASEKMAAREANEELARKQDSETIHSISA